jgi:hypothetical protein
MRRKRILFATILLLVGGYFGYNYLYQDHRDIQTEDVFLETNSDDLIGLFQESNTPAVLNQTIQIEGVVTQIEGDGITLDDKVHCSFPASQFKVSVGEEVVVKGRCIGYDDLFEIVKLDQSAIIN